MREILAMIGILAATVAVAQVGPAIAPQRTQVYFKSPSGLHVHWYTDNRGDGKAGYALTPLEVPGRYAFRQGFVYGLKLTKIPGHPGLELFPTLEVARGGPRVADYLAHNSVPVEFSDDEIKQVAAGGFLVKVVYLPNDGSGGAEVQTGREPIQEALRRGSILLVVRLGNIDRSVP